MVLLYQPSDWGSVCSHNTHLLHHAKGRRTSHSYLERKDHANGLARNIHHHGRCHLLPSCASMGRHHKGMELWKCGWCIGRIRHPCSCLPHRGMEARRTSCHCWTAPSQSNYDSRINIRLLSGWRFLQSSLLHSHLFPGHPQCQGRRKRDSKSCSHSCMLNFYYYVGWAHHYDWLFRAIAYRWGSLDDGWSGFDIHAWPQFAIFDVDWLSDLSRDRDRLVHPGPHHRCSSRG